MIGFVIFLMVLSISLFVLEPFFTTRKLPNRFTSQKQVKNKNLKVRREAIVRSLKDLDLDYSTNMIDEADYNTLKSEYNSRLDKINMELGGSTGKVSKADVKIIIENEVSLRRRTQTRTVEPVDLVKCPECNTGVAADSRFCPNCGTKLS